jgi:murein DD-endopeptidase MepM/ murein hydrolase activator NlpD
LIDKILRLCWIFILLAGGCVPPPASLRIQDQTPQHIFEPTPTPEKLSPTETSQATATVAAAPKATIEQAVISISPTPILALPLFSGCDQPICYTPFEGILKLPVPPGDNQTVEPSYRYGTTQNGERIPHDGVEFYTLFGSPVFAVEDGVVLYAGHDEIKQWGRFTNFYGNLVILKHELNAVPQPIYTLYAHLSDTLVNTGDSVQAGQKIGEVGASGSAMGSHLHFEVRLDQPGLQNTQNPELFLALKNDSNQKTGILVGRVLSNSTLQSSQILVIQKIENGTLQTDQAQYLETYEANIPSNSELNENFVISNLPVGQYRISTFIEERFFESYFFIKENILTNINLHLEE